MARESRKAPEAVPADELVQTLDVLPHRETIDDLDALLGALPPEIVAAVRSLPEVEGVIEVVMDLCRRPEARFPDAEVTLLDREINEADLSYVVDHIVPLKRGGADTPANMQWQTEAAAKAKDKWE